MDPLSGLFLFSFFFGLAFTGVSLIGGRGYEAADDWAALVASGVILFTGIRLLRPATEELMDRSPEPDLVARAP